MIKASSGVIIAFLVLCCFDLTAQERSATFQVLNVPANAHQMALGSYNITSGGGNPSQFLSNPALMADSMQNSISFNYVAFSGAYKMALANYHFKIGKGTASIAARHLSFGEMEGYDDAGYSTGTFKAGQSVLTFGYQQNQGVFSYGANVELINAGMGGFDANAIAFSLGGLFSHPENDFTIGAAIKNIGFVLSDFTSTSNSKLPWDIQLGASFKPEHMPFRFSLTGHHLLNKDLLSEAIDDSFAREVLSHVVIGSELILSKNISVMFAYNHLIRQELKLQQTARSAGFSYGFQFRTKKIEFAYGRGAYHVAGASHVLSLNLDLNTFFRKI